MKRIVMLFCVMLFFVGFAILFYPTISNWFYTSQQKESISRYMSAVEELSEKDYQVIWTTAKAYNRSLVQKNNPYFLTEAEYETYLSILNISQSGMMGYLKIPKIQLELPIYHGTEESVLQKAVGHIPGSALPVGGENTHCVLSAHRGLPSAKLFTDLDKLRKGDIFVICVLDQELVYEVYQILVTDPNDLSVIDSIEGKDYCTLMTCTPYGINTHRLLVCGKRI